MEVRVVSTRSQPYASEDLELGNAEGPRVPSHSLTTSVTVPAVRFPFHFYEKGTEVPLLELLQAEHGC